MFDIRECPIRYPPDYQIGTGRPIPFRGWDESAVPGLGLGWGSSGNRGRQPLKKEEPCSRGQGIPSHSVGREDVNMLIYTQRSTHWLM